MKMKKILVLPFWLIIFVIFFTKSVFALTDCVEYRFSTDTDSLVQGEFSKIIFSVKVNALGDTYTIRGGGIAPWDEFEARGLEPDDEGWLPERHIATGYLLSAGTHELHIIREPKKNDYCTPFSYTITGAPTPTSAYSKCRLEATSDNGKLNEESIVTINGTGIPPLYGQAYYNLRVYSRDGVYNKPFRITLDGENFSLVLPESLDINTYDVDIIWIDPNTGSSSDVLCTTWFRIDPIEGEAPTPVPTIPVLNCPQWCEQLLEGDHPDYACLMHEECKDNCYDCYISADCTNDKDCFIPGITPGVTPEIGLIDCQRCAYKCLACELIGTPVPTYPVPDLKKLCDQVPDNLDTEDWNEHSECLRCVKEGKLYTAIGCLEADISLLLRDYILKYGIGIAGGIAFLLILFGGFTIMVSAGNPESVAKGKEMITAALTGLLIIIFSVFILRLIGVDILRIPGFGPTPTIIPTPTK